MPHLPDLAPFAWALLACGALLVGLSKTALPGINTLAIAIFAAILPAKASTGALLLLLIVGDIFALVAYRRHADWPTLIKLAPSVLAGLAVGGVFLAFVNDDWVRRTIGVILLLLVLFTVWRRHQLSASAIAPRTGTLARLGYGSLSGFTTMVANAGGPAMSMYLLAAKFEVKAFLGTAAWFFAVINITKLPVSIGLGFITPETLMLDAALIPGVVTGAFLGRWIVSRIRQSAFDNAVIAFTVLGSAYLLFAP